MKGILFGGCSFTWGQGLYFYSDLPNLFNQQEGEYDGAYVTFAHKKFMETIRYPRLVANHFKTFEVVRRTNGGSDDETFQFFKDNIFLNENGGFRSGGFTYNDFSYIIIQISQLFRNKFEFEVDGEKKFDNQIFLNMDFKNSPILRWMEVNNYSFDDLKNQFTKQQYQRLVKELKFYEEKGIKTKILTWDDDLLDYIKNDEYLNSRFIRLYYNNEVFETIKQLQEKHKEMCIKYDPYFNEYVYNDTHPSKKCHRVIADNIISVIEKEL